MRWMVVTAWVGLLAIPFLCPSCRAAPLQLPSDPGNLEGPWLFRTDPGDVGEGEGWQRPEWDDGSWQTLAVPGYWEAQGVTDPRPGQPPRPRNGMPHTDYDGVAWYRLRFTAPAAWEDQELQLSLGSVDDEDRTFVNGQLVGQTPDRAAGGLAAGVAAVSVWRTYVVPPGVVKSGQENVLAIRVLDGGGPGGLMGPLPTLLPTTEMSKMRRLPQADRPLAQRFADPPAAARILKIIHSWPDRAEDQAALIRSLLAQGFGGVVCNVSFTDYLESPERWVDFVRAVQAARQAGMALWLYDERGYPSGNAGGLTMDGKLLPPFLPEAQQAKVPPPPSVHPDWEARGLFIAEARSSGEPVALDLPPGKLVRAAAYPIVKGVADLTAPTELTALVRDGKLSWTAPAGEWQVLAITEDRLYEGTHAQVSLADKLPYINLLMPEPTARFLEVTHDRYAQRLGSDLGKDFVATFTDEPSLMSMFMRPMPYRVLPWAPNLPGEFRKRRGYTLDKVLAQLVLGEDATARRARHDFWLTVGELVAESFFGQIQDWCHRHDLRSGGHLLAEESIVGHVPLYGDFFRCLRRLDAPSIDCLTSLPPEVPWYIARLVSGAAELEGRSVTMCETSDFGQIYRAGDDQRPVREVTEAEVRGTCNRLLMNGITTITSYYSFGGLSSAQLRRLNHWVGRCGTMLAGGSQVADIAVLYPIESIWPRFIPARNGATDAPGALAVEQAYRAALDGLWADGRDFTIVDSRGLADAKPKAGALIHGALRWRVVVLPATDTLPAAAWQNLARFWRQGGAIIALGALPTNTEREFPSRTVQALAKELFGTKSGPRVQTNAAGGVGIYLPTGSEMLLPTVLGSVLERDVTLPPGAPLHATHRRVEGHEVYFLINDSPGAFSGQVDVAATGGGELWDPAKGETTALGSGKAVSLSLEPYGGALLRFAKARTPRRLKPGGGGLPGLELTSLPLAEPGLSRGEFVRDQLLPDPAHSAKDRPAWRAIGTLTKTKVDTFLFASFRYPSGLDLREATCLALDTWVPEGQQTPAQLLCLLHDRDGGIYLASLGRPLGQEGHIQSFVPMSRFELAGWSKDPDGRLDLEHVAALSIGWGGYFGQDGERVEFSVALPRQGRLRQ